MPSNEVGLNDNGRAGGSRLAGRLLAVLLLALAGTTLARECTAEVEPNDLPHQGTELQQPDTLCLAGDLLDNGDQDVFTWQVTESQAGVLWQVELEGFEEGLTQLHLMQLEFLDNQIDVTARHDLLSIGSLYGQTTVSEPFMLTPGRYYLGLSKAGGGGEYVALIRPVDEVHRSSSLDPGPGQPQSGAFSSHGSLPGSLDIPWTVPAGDASALWRLELNVPLGSDITVSLKQAAAEIGAGSSADGHLLLDGYGLGSGDFTISLSGVASNHYLRLSVAGQQSDGQEVEPNQDAESANQFPLGSQMRGVAGRDADWFRVDVSAEDAATAWTLSTGSAVPLNVRLYDDENQRLLERTVSGELGPLHFSAGTHYLEVREADDAPYILELSRTEPVTAGWEREPNDFLASAFDIGAEGQARGLLSDGGDADILAFEVSGPAQLWRVQLAGQGELELGLLSGDGTQVMSTRGAQRLRLDNVQLPAGTHYFRVGGAAGEYAVRLLALGPAPEPEAMDLPAADAPLPPVTTPQPEPQGAEEAAARPAEAELPVLPPPPAGLVEIEPNDDSTRAGLLIPGVPRVGVLHDRNDQDHYRFFLADDQPVRLELVAPAGVEPLSIRLQPAGITISPNRDAAAGTPVSGDVHLLAGDHQVVIRSGDTQGGWYQLRLTLLNNAVPADAEAELPLEIELSSSAEQAAAYWHQGQQIDLTAEMRNTGSTALELSLAVATSDAQVSASIQPSLSLAPGASSQVPVAVMLPADLRDDVPLNISVAASSPAGSSGAMLPFSANCTAPPLNPADWWPVPPSMLGRLNVLWRAFGSELVGSHAFEERARALADGMVTPAHGSWVGNEAGDTITYRLAADSPVELIGAVIHPLVNSAVDRQLRDFLLETSLDGVTFTQVLEGTLGAARIDQAFMFDHPVRATHFRLTGLTDHAGRSNGGYLGELRLLAADPSVLGPHDLADPALGGHVVWSDPMVGNNQFLAGRSSPLTVDVAATGSSSFVLGFHNTRTAQITTLEWQDFPESLTAGMAFPAVTVEVSMTGAAGPWQPLSEWTFERDSEGTARLQLEQPTWARYLRFSGRPADDDQRHLHMPHRVSVFERPADGSNYLSILGEWGTGSTTSVYEHLNPPPAIIAVDDGDAGDTMGSATSLAPGSAAQGTVEVAADVDWYRLSIAPGHNQLTVRLSGEPVIAYEYELLDAAGQPVAAAVTRGADGDTLTLYADPGDYYLRIEEPRRSVVFAWDTSGSMGPYLDITYNALSAFARDISAEREHVQLLAFNMPSPTWLLPYWIGNAERVQRTVVEYDRTDNSSNSEVALIPATNALGQREGTRAIMLITDAETDGYGRTTELWRQIERVLPRIFTFEVSSGGGLRAQQMMQGWAAANHGHYTLAASIGDLDSGFRRANCILRRPKHYRIEVESVAAAPPGPGTLSITRPEGAAQPAVEVIFDASGSMGTLLPSGEQRLAAARQVLADLVSGGLPEGAPFALRAFGQVEPTTCNMRLEVPFGPLDPTAALQAVNAIEMKLLSQTPLAAAILASAEDLAAAGGSRTLILITDGVESCGGDPIEAVRQLRQNNPVEIAIVSLGIEDAQIAEFTALAEATGASYVDVSSMEQLQQSVQAALNPAYEVYDADGLLVASGVVDGPAVELDMGVYTVRIIGLGVREYPNVQVPAESSVTLTYGGQ